MFENQTLGVDKLDRQNSGGKVMNINLVELILFISFICSMAQDASGMKGYRSRTERGPLRAKREDTHVSTIEKMYDRDFEVRGDMQLGTLLAKKGYDSLNDLLRKEHHKGS